MAEDWFGIDSPQFFDSSEKHLMKQKMASGSTVRACQYCPYTTVDRSNMKRHIRRRHSSTNEFKCEFCPRQYSYKTDLSTHVKLAHKIHTPRHCGLCSFEASSLQAMRRHFLEHHGNDDNHGNMFHACPVCGESFRTDSALVEHLATIHGQTGQMFEPPMQYEDVIPELSPSRLTQQVQGHGDLSMELEIDKME